MGNEPTEGEQRRLPALVPRHNPPSEGWLARMAVRLGAARLLFGWKAASTRSELEHVLAEQQSASGFSPEEAALLKNVLVLRERRIEHVMVPRPDIVAVSAEITLGALIKVFENVGHSRLVVYNDTLDDPAGMVHIRDLLAFMAEHAANETTEAGDGAAPEDPGPGERDHDQFDLGKIDLAMPLSQSRIIREILYAPPSMPALDLLAKMQATRIHLALVIDEYGGTDGLASMEDLVELIVGDIADEHDEDESADITRQQDGSFLAAGRASLEDVRATIGEDFDVGEAESEVDTLGGYLVMRAGHVPVRGELVPGPYTFEAEVLDSDPRRVKRVKIYRRDERPPATLREASAAARPAPGAARAP